MLGEETGPDHLDGLVGEFVVECRENLDQLDLDLLALEREPGSADLLSGAFRTLHTIKGSSSFLGFEALEAVTHAGESLLGALREGRLSLTPDLVTLLLEVEDATRDVVDEIERSGGEGAVETATLVARVAAARDGEPDPAPTTESAAVARPVAPPGAVEPDPSSQTPLLGDLLLARGVVTPQTLGQALAAQKAGDSRPLGVILVGLGVPEEQIDATVDHQHEMRASLVHGTVRVDVALLDSLMELGSEVGRLTRELRESVYREAPRLTQSVEAVTDLLAHVNAGLVKARLQPVHAAWSRLPRMVRDLSAQVGKTVELTTAGGDTEIDRTVLEAVRDPLTHLVRNSIDHGIEPPGERVSRGKSPTGHLTVRAYLDHADVVIELCDDGDGIDPERIRREALKAALRTPAELAQLSDDEVIELIFEPGLSTARAVTTMSGRGVGMDVVRTSVERLGGRVELLSERGRGTTIRLRTPLTVAVVSARLVTVAGHRYALPGSARGGEGSGFLDLRSALGHPPASTPGVSVVVAAGAGRIEVMVDVAEEPQELMVRPSQDVSAPPLLLGSATCPDGTVVGVLDAAGLAEVAGLAVEPDHAHEITRLRAVVAEVWASYGLAGPDGTSPWSDPGSEPPDRPLRLLRGTAVVRSCVPVSDSEEVVLEASASAASVLTARMLGAESVTEEEVVDALGEIVNIVGGTMKDVVSQVGQLGLPVVQWLEGADLDTSYGRAEVGCVMDGEPVRVRLAGRGTSRAGEHDDWTEGSRRMRILIVDDSRVMRQIIARTLRQAGYTGHDLVEAGDGQEALTEIDNQTPDLILSDWNMPVMDGLELLRRLRATGVTTPFGFVTSEVSASIAALATEAGADFVITKPFTPQAFRDSLDPVLPS